jgi:hypothetical protein
VTEDRGADSIAARRSSMKRFNAIVWLMMEAGEPKIASYYVES